MKRRALWIVVSLAALAALAWQGRERLVWLVIEQLDPSYEANAGAAGSWPEYSGADASRPQLAVRLTRVADGFEQITDLQRVPGPGRRLVVLEKGGRAWVLDLDSGARRELLRLAVRTSSEEGLLGLAFHPSFPEDPRFFLNYVTRIGDQDHTRVEAWTAGGAALTGAQPAGVVLEQAQPYQNHNAGALAFGPDGMLYVGFGDGGAARDPHGHGQEGRGWLGSMLRVDVSPAAGYRVPADNPLLDRPDVAPETWALGLRNPWRYSFAPDGRLVIADVGQNAWEEVSVAQPGDNLGWSVREGRHCFNPPEGCPTAGLRDPVYEYGREEGVSITGGAVYMGSGIPLLKGRYVFGDFGTGRIWAIDLPPAGSEGQGPLAEVTALGRWPINPSTFGVDPDGELLVADFNEGVIWRITQP